MRAVLVIAWKDLKQRLRDRSAIVAAFVAPLMLAFIVSAAFGSGFIDNDFQAHYLVADADGTDLSRAFATQVLGAPQLKDQVTVAKSASAGAAREVITREGASAAFLIPKGFAAAVVANRRTSMSVLTNPEQPIGSQVAEAIARAYTDQINASRLSVLTTLRAAQTAGRTPPAVQELAAAVARERIPVLLVDAQVGRRRISGANYFGPAMAIFSLFFTTAFVARSLVAERMEGTLPRILAAPVPRSSVVLGKSFTAFVLGLASFGVMFLVFGLVMNVLWGDPLALTVLAVATVLAVMGLMTFTQTLARTQEGADAVAQVATVSLALLGGNFFPLFQMPETMQKVSYITPNGWALRGFTDVAYDGATLSDLGLHLLAISAFAAVTMTLGVLRSRRLT